MTTVSRSDAPHHERDDDAVKATDSSGRAGPGWLLDEVRSAGRENLDPEHVTQYDSKMDAQAAAEVTMLLDIGLNAAATVVDLGAGTGQFVRAVAPRCRRVVAADVSPAMLATLRANVDAARLQNVEIVEAGFLTYDHLGSPADVVYSRFALHHLPDFWKAVALRRVRRTLRPGGIFRLSDVIYDFEPDEVEERIEAWCATATPDADVDLENNWARWELEEHVREEQSTFRWLLEPMLERAGFAIESVEFADDLVGRYVARAV